MAAGADRLLTGGGFFVDDQAGAAHGPQLHVLGAMAPVERESQLAEQRFQAGGVPGPDFGEVEAGGLGHPGKRGKLHRVAAPGRSAGRTAFSRGRVGLEPSGALLFEPDQRPHGIDGRAFDVGLAEDVVEHFQRYRSGIAGADHVAHELGEVELALAREHPVVPAPGQHVHGQLGGIGHLDEEDFRRVEGLDRRGVPAAGEDVEGVQAGAQVGVVHHVNQPVGVLVVADVLAPGQGLVGDLDAVFAREVREPGELGGPEFVVVDRGRAHVGAQQHGVHAQPGHEPELGVRAAQIGGEQVLGNAVEVAERLVEVQRESEVGGQLPDILRAQR